MQRDGKTLRRMERVREMSTGASSGGRKMIALMSGGKVGMQSGHSA